MKKIATMKPERPEKNSSPPPSPPSHSSSSPSFSLLPDEITVSYLARIPRPYYPRLSILSKSFRSLISSTELYAARSRLGTTEQCLYVSLQDPSSQFTQWFTLWINPNKQRKKETTTGQQLVSIPSCNLPSLSKSMVSVGSEVYVIGGPIDESPAGALRILDCRSNTWRNGPSMIVARKDASVCVHDGKIYVLGGCKGLKKVESWAEVFDTKTQTWECLPDPGNDIPKHAINKIDEIDEIEGKIIFMTENGGTYAYDPRRYEWECCKNIFAMSELVVGNVTYVFYSTHGRYALWWSSVKNCHWREVNGVNSLVEKFMSSGFTGNKKMISCGGKVYVVWYAVKHKKKKIWCAEIVLEKRIGNEIWGQVKWVDVVHTFPMSCELFQCLAVTV